VGVCGCGPTTNGAGMSASDCVDNFTTCGVDTSVEVPPPQPTNTFNKNSEANKRFITVPSKD
jgi:hypothetical protein